MIWTRQGRILMLRRLAIPLTPCLLPHLWGRGSNFFTPFRGGGCFASLPPAIFFDTFGVVSQSRFAHRSETIGLHSLMECGTQETKR